MPVCVACHYGHRFYGTEFVYAQGLINVRMRALASAILIFTINLLGLGLGLGLVLVRVIIDLINNAEYGTRWVGIAVLGVSLVLVKVAIWQFLAAGKYINDEMQSTKA